MHTKTSAWESFRFVSIISKYLISLFVWYVVFWPFFFGCCCWLVGFFVSFFYYRFKMPYCEYLLSKNTIPYSCGSWRFRCNCSWAQIPAWNPVYHDLSEQQQQQREKKPPKCKTHTHNKIHAKWILGIHLHYFLLQSFFCVSPFVCCSFGWCATLEI